MSDFKEKLEHAKDKIVGEIKENTGKVFHNEDLELKGKAQVAKADAEKKVHDVKDKIVGKVNDTIDDLKHK